MVTTVYSSGDVYVYSFVHLTCLSTDTKPTHIPEQPNVEIPNGSLLSEMDTKLTYIYDKETSTWYVYSSGKTTDTGNSSLRLYYYGDECNDITGGWTGTVSGTDYDSKYPDYVNKNTDHIDMSVSNWRSIKLEMTNKYDLSGYSKILVVGFITELQNSQADGSTIYPGVIQFSLINSVATTEIGRITPPNGTALEKITNTPFSELYEIPAELLPKTMAFRVYTSCGSWIKQLARYKILEISAVK